MPLPPHLSALIGAALCGLGALTAAETSVIARDGSRLNGSVQLAGTSIAIADRSIPIEQIVGIGGECLPARWQRQGLLLTDGDRLRGLIVSVQQGVCTGSSDLLGPFSMPVERIAAVILAPQQTSASWPTAFTGAILANGDRLPGKLAFIDERQVGIDNGRKVVGIPRERVGMVVIRSVAPAVSPRQLLWLANGDRLTVSLSGWTTEALTCETPFGPLRCTPAEMSAFWSEGPDQRPLTSQPIAGILPGVAIDRQLDGGPLLCTGRICAHGIAIRGATSLSAPVGDATKLVGEIGIIEGRASVKIIADDGRIAWDSGVVNAGTSAAMAAPLAGMTRLRIDVIPVDAGAPLVVIGWPTLVR